MTDSPDARLPFSEIPDLNSPTPHPAEKAADVQVTLHLSPEMIAALQEASQQSSEQPLSQQIVALLQQAIHPQPESQPASEASLRQELDQLKQRLGLLEAYLARVEAIEGKVNHLMNNSAVSEQNASVPPSAVSSPAEVTSDSGKALDLNQGDNPGSAVASIWMQVQQNDRPPASVPSTLQPTEPCPKCQQRMMPFKSTGREVCIGCGWTNKLRSEDADAAALPDFDIHQLLEQAAVESLENMKPRKRST